MKIKKELGSLKRFSLNEHVMQWASSQGIVKVSLFITYIRKLEGYLGRRLATDFEDLEYLRIAKYLTINE